MLKNIVLMIFSLLFIYISTYAYDPIQQVNTSERIKEAKDKKGLSVKSNFKIDDNYAKCGSMDSSGKYLYENYSVEFFHPSCPNYNHYCKDSKYCGMAPDKSYECKEDIDCEMTVLITDQNNDTVLRGVSNLYTLSSNDEVFGVVKLQRMPADFPYLVLKDTSFGSWGQGYYYHLYSTQDKFKKIIGIGPSWKGFYKDTKGNYIIGIQQDYWPEYGSNADHLTDEILYRLTSKEEYELTNKRFVIDMDANKEKIIQFSDGEINRLMTYAKKSNKKIMDYFSSKNDKSYFWTPGVDSKRWPLRLLRIRESDPRKGYVYADLFDFIRNGRIDLARQYFDILIPEQYNQFKHILPEILNSKDKLWIGYLKDLKEQSEYRRRDSDSLYFPGESTKGLYWSVFKLLNDKHGIL